MANNQDILKPGTYQLTATIKNPTPDRRYLHAWIHAKEWTGGTYFTIDHFSVGEVTLRKPNTPGQLYSYDPRFKALVPYLEKVNETAFEFMTRVAANRNGCAANVLQKLLDSGKVSDEEVKKLVQDIEHCDSDGSPRRSE